ncbi:MAG: cytochrome b/b6 domain-containing protein [Sphingomonadales bacterium]|nr:cytochrome b/b6 domain-containing protein [Sphingomonadales bacterium]MDE2570691.1 cytochrome b/b6 domain-containing protein [Sphingomonadales bacterium]
MRVDHSTKASANPLIYRTRLPVRLWHWTNALAVFVMLMSGLMIFNAHPHLYWGGYGANFDPAWLEIGNRGPHGFLRVGGLTLTTTGVLGYSGGKAVAFPALVTIPSHYNLAAAREWHFFFAWVLVLGGLAFLVWGLPSRHVQRDLAPSPAQLRPSRLWADIKAHARLQFPTGEEARHYNPLQKLAYIGVIFVLIPLVVLTGLTMSPNMDTAWPWLLEVFGGRQSARSIHFLCAMGLALFIAVHLLMVVLAGPFNELRSMVTGWYRLPSPRPTETEDAA